MEVRQARQARGWTQRKLAIRAGVPQSTIGRIEAGLVDPRVSTLERILRACGHELGFRVGQGVDRGQIQEILRWSPRERLEGLKSAAASLDRLLKARPL